MNLILGDCLEVMKTLPDKSVDAVITDPPYGLSFMGKEWDHGIPGPHFWEAALRVAKPGAHLLAFGGTRTFHRLTCAIEDAGWEIRDCLMWVYGSGFPKSLDVSKAIDKAAGAERERHLVPTKRGNLPEQAGPIGLGATGMTDISEPITASARQWDGWGTALKPAWEPIILARKPIEGTVAANVQRWGTGAINVDGCRVEGEGWTKPDGASGAGFKTDKFMGVAGRGKPTQQFGVRSSNQGRWPANLILTYPEDEYILRDDITPEQIKELSKWLDEKTE